MIGPIRRNSQRLGAPHFAAMLLFLFWAGARAAGVVFPGGQPAHIVAMPETELEKRITERLAVYLERVLQTPTKVVPNIQSVPDHAAAIILVGRTVKSPFQPSLLDNAHEAFALKTGETKNHSVVVAAGKTERGLKRAVQRLIVSSEQA